MGKRSKAATSNEAVTYEIPESFTANDCALASECSLCKIWTRPNLRTRWAMLMTRLGIVRRCSIE